LTTEERFWSKVDRSGDCWLWTAGRTCKGYAEFYLGGTMKYGHRIAYEWAHGPIPDDRELDHRHTCPKHCVNPAHLRLVTSKQNKENRSGPNSAGTSGVRGVIWDKARGAWRAQVKHNGKYIHAGRFPTIPEAEAAVIAKRNELFTHNDLDRV
jgi:hypothetical protein